MVFPLPVPRALLPVLGILVAGCSVADLDEAGKLCTGDRCPSGLACVGGVCGGPTTQDASSCSPPAGNPCKTIPRLTTPQILDCEATEFCNVPVYSLIANGLAAPVRFQVAWSDVGLHLFVSVQEWPIRPATTGGTNIYTGDAIEIFSAASAALLLGQQDDDSTHFIVAPPPAGTTGLGGEAIFFQPNEGSATYVVPGGVYVGCVVPNVGYNLEIQMPWSLPWLPPTAAPTAGETIGFDSAVDVKPATGDQIQTWEYLGPAPTDGAQSQCAVIGAPDAPYCDDRSFCRPILQ